MKGGGEEKKTTILVLEPTCWGGNQVLRSDIHPDSRSQEEKLPQVVSPLRCPLPSLLKARPTIFNIKNNHTKAESRCYLNIQECEWQNQHFEGKNKNEQLIIIFEVVLYKVDRHQTKPQRSGRGPSPAVTEERNQKGEKEKNKDQ